MTLPKALLRWVGGLALAAGSAGVSADTVYVTLERDNALAVLDGASGELKQTVPVGRRPRGIALSGDGRRLYLAAGDDQAIEVYDTAGLKRIDRLAVDHDPKTFALDPAGKYLYASNDRDDQLAVVDIAQRTIVKRIGIGHEPEGVSVSPDGHWVISTSEADGSASWINGERLAPVDVTAVGARPRASRFTDDGQQLWVSCQDAGTVVVIDPANARMIKRLSFAPPGVPADQVKPVGIRIDRQRRFAYVALGRADRVAVVDAQKLEVMDYLAVGSRVWNLEFSPDQQRLYAANGLSGDISIIDLAQRRVTKSVAVGKSPWAIAVR